MATKQELIQAATDLGVEVPAKATKAELETLIAEAEANAGRRTFMSVSMNAAKPLVIDAIAPLAKKALSKEKPETPTARREVVARVTTEALSKKATGIVGEFASLLASYEGEGRSERADYMRALIRRGVDRKVRS